MLPQRWPGPSCADLSDGVYYYVHFRACGSTFNCAYRPTVGSSQLPGELHHIDGVHAKRVFDHNTWMPACMDLQEAEDDCRVHKCIQVGIVHMPVWLLTCLDLMHGEGHRVHENQFIIVVVMGRLTLDADGSPQYCLFEWGSISFETLCIARGYSRGCHTCRSEASLRLIVFVFQLLT